MDRWHGKHPLPWDFFYTFNDASGKNLNWFWSSWFFGNNYIDLAVRDVKKEKKYYTVSLKNIGGMPAPVDFIVMYNDGTNETLHQTPEIWEHDMQQTTININTNKKIKSLKLDGGIFMDADESNNEWKGEQAGKGFQQIYYNTKKPNELIFHWALYFYYPFSAEVLGF